MKKASTITTPDAVSAAGATAAPVPGTGYETVDPPIYRDIPPVVRQAMFLLGGCVLRQEEPAAEARMRTEVFPALDDLHEQEWMILLRLLIRQEIAGLVYPFVQAYADHALREAADSAGGTTPSAPVPAPVLDMWAKHAMFGVVYQEKAKNSLAKAMACFGGEPLKPVLTKGLRMSLMYPDPTLRHSVDLDLFAERSQYGRIASCWHEAGYHTPKKKIRNPVHEEFRYEGRVMLELHGSLVHPWYFPVDARFWYAAFARNAVPMQVHGETVWLSSPGDEFVFQVIHLIRHYLCAGAFMKLFLDLAVLLTRGMTVGDRQYAADTLKRLGFFHAACHLAAASADMLGFTVPEPFALSPSEMHDSSLFRQDVFLVEELGGEQIKRWQHGLVHFYLFSRGKWWLKGPAYLLQTGVDILIYGYGIRDSFRFNTNVYRRYRERETIFRQMGLLAMRPA